MCKYMLLIPALLTTLLLWAQPSGKGRIIINVWNELKAPAQWATVQILTTKDTLLVQTTITDSTGKAVFNNISPGRYLCSISMINHHTQYISFFLPDSALNETPSFTVTLLPDKATLKAVNITAYKPAIQQLPDRTIINIDAVITNAGATLLEVLEKSPGITIDKSGNIVLKGRSGVLVMMDGKPLYISGADLINLLGSLNASQAEQIEIMDNPSAKYDAAGNTGIINIKTKKNQQAGFNGNINISYGQGRYYKINNSVMLNYRSGKWNYFLNYSMNAGKNFMDLYALRTYYEADRKTVAALLNQPTWLNGNNNTNMIRAGVDYYLNQKTTIGVIIPASIFNRNNTGMATAEWLNAFGNKDSVIHTQSINTNKWHNTGLNVYLRHSFNASSELTADLDWLGYAIGSEQFFQNTLSAPGGYQQSLRGYLDAAIHIYAAKLDYTRQLNTKLKLETGWKSSYIHTDNAADYYNLQNGNWQPDQGKTNHFLYRENIHAFYGNVETKKGNVTGQLGLRYEYTGYHANQQGNAVVKDSSFSRNYNSLFPSAFVTWQADSANRFTITAGRRIERPGFQKLNPFVFVINKYTYQQGNPYFRPQYAWNTEISHSFKDKLTSTVSYNMVRDYFSQLFFSDSTGTVIYTEGNVGRMHNLGIGVSLQTGITSWWNISADVTLNHKKMKGLLWKVYTASFTQMNLNITNQLRFGKGWAGEISGSYTTRSQQDIQEILQPTGMVAAGLSKQILKNKGALKLSFRDIFYTQVMAGFTRFALADEYFSIRRDSRVCSISFSCRFGKTIKASPERTGGAGDEIQRVGS